MRSLLRWTFEAGDDATIVGEAADGDAALALMAGLGADVIVLDLQMPGPPPDELLVAMTDAAPGVPIVTFSGFEPDLVAGQAASLVALHVPKTTDLAVVRDAIVGVGRGP
jgi:DNA-binding NarL/FixJ family response regulator